MPIYVAEENIECCDCDYIPTITVLTEDLRRYLLSHTELLQSLYENKPFPNGGVPDQYKGKKVKESIVKILYKECEEMNRREEIRRNELKKNNPTKKYLEKYNKY